MSFAIEGLGNPANPNKPYRMLLTAEAKAGKSTLVTNIPNSIGIITEDGLNYIKDPKAQVFPKVSNMSEFYELIRKAIEYFNTNKPEQDADKRPTIWVDSIDQLLVHMAQDIATENQKANLDDIPYGRGQIYLAEAIRRRVLSGLEILHAMGCNIIITCHAQQKEVLNPLGENYLAVVPRIHTRSEAVLGEWVDAIAYISLRKAVTVEGSGLAKEGKVSENVTRKLILETNPVYQNSGNRLGLKNCDLNADAFLSQIYALQQPLTQTKKGSK